MGDGNPVSGEDYWGVTDYRAHTGNYSAWCAAIGTQEIGGQNNTDVDEYDDNMQSDLVVNLQVNGFASLTLYFYYYSRTESGGGDWIQAWYEANGTQTVIFNNTGGTGNKWDLATVDVPTDVERLIIRFHSDGANHGFEGAYVDDILLTGVEDVPPESAVATLPTYTNAAPFAVPYGATDNLNASGVDYVELWYRKGTSGNFTLYTRPANPLGQWITPTVPFDASLVGGDGLYELYTIAVDRAGNREDPPAGPDASVTVDTTLPTLAIVAPAAGDQFAPGSVAVEWQAADSLSGIDRYEASLDGGAFVTVPGTTTAFSNVGTGSHTVTVRAYDRAGNVRAESVTFTVSSSGVPMDLSSWLWLLLLVALVAIGAVLYLWWSRRREEPSEPGRAPSRDSVEPGSPGEREERRP